MRRHGWPGSGSLRAVCPPASRSPTLPWPGPPTATSNSPPRSPPPTTSQVTLAASTPSADTDRTTPPLRPCPLPTTFQVTHAALAPQANRHPGNPATPSPPSHHVPGHPRRSRPASGSWSERQSVRYRLRGLLHRVAVALAPHAGSDAVLALVEVLGLPLVADLPRDQVGDQAGYVVRSLGAEDVVLQLAASGFGFQGTVSAGSGRPPWRILNRPPTGVQEPNLHQPPDSRPERAKKRLEILLLGLGIRPRCGGEFFRPGPDAGSPSGVSRGGPARTLRPFSDSPRTCDPQASRGAGGPIPPTEGVAMRSPAQVMRVAGSRLGAASWEAASNSRARNRLVRGASRLPAACRRSGFSWRHPLKTSGATPGRGPRPGGRGGSPG